VDFAEQQRRPAKHLVAFSIVVVLHLLLGYALVSGLARRVVEVIKAPIETKIIEEVKPPPPPPENLPPPPKFAPPPPSFVPPPEVVVNPPPVQQPTITTTQVAPPPAPVNIAPPPAPEAPPAPPAPRVARAAVLDVGSCERPSYPAAAQRAEAKGTTKIRFTVDAQGVVDPSKTTIERSAGSSREHKMLDRAAAEALGKCRFKPGTDENGKPVGGTTVVEYVWNLE
jgi:protein TonB